MNWRVMEWEMGQRFQSVGIFCFDLERIYCFRNSFGEMSARKYFCAIISGVVSRQSFPTFWILVPPNLVRCLSITLLPVHHKENEEPTLMYRHEFFNSLVDREGMGIQKVGGRVVDVQNNTRYIQGVCLYELVFMNLYRGFTTANTVFLKILFSQDEEDDTLLPENVDRSELRTAVMKSMDSLQEMSDPDTVKAMRDLSYICNKCKLPMQVNDFKRITWCCVIPAIHPFAKVRFPGKELEKSENISKSLHESNQTNCDSNKDLFQREV